MQRLVLARPDDWHLHLRDGARLASVVAHSAAEFARAIVMPNLVPPVETVEQARAYRERILAACRGRPFEPLMTLYLTGRTSADEVRRAAADPVVHAVKLYPAGATTNSEAGVRRLEPLYPVLEAMAEVGLPLLIHGETTDPDTDVFDREARFISDTLVPLVERFEGLKVVLEHITTREAVEFVRGARPRVGATITAHHMLYNRSAIFRGGVRPDLYCLPILKRESHRRALVEAATSGDPRFFLGTDSAPHEQRTKENACGCAGMFSAHAGIELYAEAFESVGKLDKLEGFASDFGADFYQLPRNTDRIRLARRDWSPPANYPYSKDGGALVPMRAGEIVRWQMVS